MAEERKLDIIRKSLRKSLLRAGRGALTPEAGDTVKILYSTYFLDWTLFDSSDTKPLTLTLGQGKFIKAWELGIPTMRKGERALLVCGPKYAYGKKGIPGKVPPDTVLVFDIELLSWTSAKGTTGDEQDTLSFDASIIDSKSEDTDHAAKEILAASSTDDDSSASRQKEEAVPGIRDGSVLKRITKTSDSKQHPFLGGTVSIALTGRLASGVGTFASHGKDKPLEVIVGSGQVVEGLDLALLGMKLGEAAEFIVQPCLALGAGSQTIALTEIPADSVLTFSVELLASEEDPNWHTRTPLEKLSQVQLLKEAGNARFKEGKFRMALQWYSGALEVLAREPRFAAGFSQDEGLASSATATGIACNLNVAAAALKVGEFNRTLSACDKVLVHGPNVKALFRRAEANAALELFQEAAADARKAISLVPNNTALRALLHSIRSGEADFLRAAKASLKTGPWQAYQQADEKDTSVPPKQKPRYLRAAKSFDIDVNNEEQLAELERQQNEAEASWADEVAEMKRQHGYSTVVPPPDEKPGRRREGHYAIGPIWGRMFAQGVQGRGYTRPFGFSSRGGARIQRQMPDPESRLSEDPYLEVPGMSQVKCSIENMEEALQPDPFAKPIIITGDLFGQDGFATLDAQTAGGSQEGFYRSAFRDEPHTADTHTGTTSAERTAQERWSGVEFPNNSSNVSFELTPEELSGANLALDVAAAEMDVSGIYRFAPGQPGFEKEPHEVLPSRFSGGAADAAKNGGFEGDSSSCHRHPNIEDLKSDAEESQEMATSRMQAAEGDNSCGTSENQEEQDRGEVEGIERLLCAHEAGLKTACAQPADFDESMAGNAFLDFLKFG